MKIIEAFTENIASRYKETNNSTVNIHGSDNNNNVDNKISGYLNSLYSIILIILINQEDF